ncbi:Uncharacterized protein BM_BM17403 [Brugia malayi]|uniref:Integrase catalytic domain-containing protein n=1 Tax=Brugia malayi TaxID=6279 RepID=A0A4E9F7S5_BRUMA|nr:Uncharacterized protein BM_BM17403 [Brugia malayi]VIO92086.1 Uncharacterized protein BM_BM17403 [Brugia malayi]
MTWKNIISKAPWQGGIYERLIGLTKNALRRAIGRKFLAERELVTLIAEVEGILNTRPLTYANFDDCVIIRPIDFILPNASLHLPINEVETPTGKLLDRPINVLYPLEVNDEEIHLEPNEKENMKIPETEQNTEELQEPIAMRTRSNTKRQSRLKEVSKSNLMVSLLSVSMLYTLMIPVKAKKECQWKTGILFNIPEKWNCEEITAQNSNLLQVNVYTRSPYHTPCDQV